MSKKMCWPACARARMQRWVNSVIAWHGRTGTNWPLDTTATAGRFPPPPILSLWMGGTRTVEIETYVWISSRYYRTATATGFVGVRPLMGFGCPQYHRCTCALCCISYFWPRSKVQLLTVTTFEPKKFTGQTCRKDPRWGFPEHPPRRAYSLAAANASSVLDLWYGPSEVVVRVIKFRETYRLIHETV